MTFSGRRSGDGPPQPSYFHRPKVTITRHYRGKLTAPIPVASLKAENLSPRGTTLKDEHSKASPERQNKRIQVALPIRVTYWDDEQKPGLEVACTYDISVHGARVTGLRCVKEVGDVVAIERGRSKAFCRVVWVGKPDSEFQGQIGLQCVESDRVLWEAELRDMVEVFEPVLLDGDGKRSRTFAAHERRRRKERYSLEGTAEMVEPDGSTASVELKNISEIGCLVLTKQVVPAGTELQVTLHVEDQNLTVKGQVRHSEPHVGLGIEFRQIRKGERQILKFLIRKLAEKNFEDTLQFEIHK
jgi:PilZ domain